MINSDRDYKSCLQLDTRSTYCTLLMLVYVETESQPETQDLEKDTKIHDRRRTGHFNFN